MLSTSSSGSCVRWKCFMIACSSGARIVAKLLVYRALGTNFLLPFHLLQRLRGIAAELDGHSPLARGGEHHGSRVAAKFRTARKSIPHGYPLDGRCIQATFTALDGLARIPVPNRHVPYDSLHRIRRQRLRRDQEGVGFRRETERGPLLAVARDSEE